LWLELMPPCDRKADGARILGGGVAGQELSQNWPGV
jgi:hypothetical protein